MFLLFFFFFFERKFSLKEVSQGNKINSKNINLLETLWSLEGIGPKNLITLKNKFEGVKKRKELNNASRDYRKQKRNENTGEMFMELENYIHFFF